ncbi:MAG: hypothetical protein V4562_06860 [Pseudomonadota bacterium]
MLLTSLVTTVPVHAQSAQALKARHTALREPLANNVFQRPLVLESSQTSGSLQGDIYAQMGQPFAVAGPALRDIGNWCDILILHLNVKHCDAVPAKEGDVLKLSVGRKFDQPVADAYQLVFGYTVAKSTPDYLQIVLDAPEGPLGTSNYRIVLEVVALDAQRSFLHLSYSYGYGVAARLAMQGYLATVGRDKVGFSVVGKQADGQPSYIGGTRGVVERNTMRYYLAIESYLNSLALPAADQTEKRLGYWFAGVERYPQQLHEMERADYLAMKRREIQRMR